MSEGVTSANGNTLFLTDAQANLGSDSLARLKKRKFVTVTEKTMEGWGPGAAGDGGMTPMAWTVQEASQMKVNTIPILKGAYPAATPTLEGGGEFTLGLDMSSIPPSHKPVMVFKVACTGGNAVLPYPMALFKSFKIKPGNGKREGPSLCPEQMIWSPLLNNAKNYKLVSVMQHMGMTGYSSTTGFPQGSAGSANGSATLVATGHTVEIRIPLYDFLFGGKYGAVGAAVAKDKFDLVFSFFNKINSQDGVTYVGVLTPVAGSFNIEYEYDASGDAAVEQVSTLFAAGDFHIPSIRWNQVIVPKVSVAAGVAIDIDLSPNAGSVLAMCVMLLGKTDSDINTMNMVTNNIAAPGVTDFVRYTYYTWGTPNTTTGVGSEATFQLLDTQKNDLFNQTPKTLTQWQSSWNRFVGDVEDNPLNMTDFATGYQRAVREGAVWLTFGGSLRKMMNKEMLGNLILRGTEKLRITPGTTAATDSYTVIVNILQPQFCEQRNGEISAAKEFA
jgi:hypothetical protein